MSELLPYEEQLAGKLANLPLPDEDKGWDAMRKMLEEDDDDGGIIPPVNRGCRTWGAILLLIALVAGIVTLTWKKHTVNQTDAPHNTTTIKDSGFAGKTPVKTDTATIAGNTPTADTTINTTARPGTAKQPADDVAQPAQQSTSKRAASAYTGKRMAVRVDKKQQQQPYNNPGKTGNTPPPVRQIAEPLTSTGIEPYKPVSQPPGNAAIVPGDNKSPVTGKDTVARNDTTGKPVAALTDTAHNNSNTKKPPEDDDSNDDNKVWFSAGLALQQLIPVDGQKAVPYSSSGRKGSLGDYIPSAYVRVYHKRKFLQVEFKYGAPQYTKDVAYQKTVISSDSASGISVANVNHVKKTYYHQLPVSIHYTPVPNVSIGAGIVWNKFQSAVVEQQTRSFRGNVMVDSNGIAIPTKLLTVKGDSATSFSKSYLQFMIEAQYTWRRFSIGARYSFGLQPYLTFTSPTTGLPQKERNASLNIFLRYELWRSKKK